LYRFNEETTLALRNKNYNKEKLTILDTHTHTHTHTHKFVKIIKNLHTRAHFISTFHKALKRLRTRDYTLKKNS